MRTLALLVLLAGCDAHRSLIVPDVDTDVPECAMKLHSEAVTCDEYGLIHWQAVPRSLFTVWHCHADETCAALTPIVDAAGLTEVVCYDFQEAGEYWRVDYITAE